MKHSTTLRLLILSSIICLLSCSDANSIATIDYNISGCFASGKGLLSIYKQNNDTVAEIQMPGEFYQKVKIDRSQLDSFAIFVKDLKAHSEDDRCTTVENFKVQFASQSFNRINGDCSWNRFEEIKRCLFPKSN
jgi:hypothetical protein